MVEKGRVKVEIVNVSKHTFPSFVLHFPHLCQEVPTSYTLSLDTLLPYTHKVWLGIKEPFESSVGRGQSWPFWYQCDTLSKALCLVDCFDSAKSFRVTFISEVLYGQWAMFPGDPLMVAQWVKMGGSKSPPLPFCPQFDFHPIHTLDL